MTVQDDYCNSTEEKMYVMSLEASGLKMTDPAPTWDWTNNQYIPVAPKGFRLIRFGYPTRNERYLTLKGKVSVKLLGYQPLANRRWIIEEVVPRSIYVRALNYLPV
jgi:hypothetical protein